MLTIASSVFKEWNLQKLVWPDGSGLNRRINRLTQRTHVF